jgi:hypothetical protein
MDAFCQQVFLASLSAMLRDDPWNEQMEFEEKIKKAWKAAKDAGEFVAKKLRAERNPPQKPK